MSIILNVIVLFICSRWLYKSDQKIGVLFGIVFTFLTLTLLSFIIAISLENEYLDGLGHLIVAGGSAILFWLISILIIIMKSDQKSLAEKFRKILIMTIVVLLPLIIFFMISNANLKIGG